MTDTTKHWNTRSEDDHQAMAELLAPLIVASRDRNFIDAKAARAQTYAWRLALADVPKPIVAEAITNIVARGVTFMPKPGEVKAECAKVLAARRDEAYTASLPPECPVCGREKGYRGPRWKEVSINGVMRHTRCDCQIAALQAADRVGQLVALPPASDEHAEALS